MAGRDRDARAKTRYGGGKRQSDGTEDGGGDARAKAAGERLEKGGPGDKTEATRHADPREGRSQTEKGEAESHVSRETHPSGTQGGDGVRSATEAGEEGGHMDEGGDGHVGRHMEERRTMAERHATESRDTMRQHRGAMRDMMTRHEKEMQEMHSRHMEEGAAGGSRAA